MIDLESIAAARSEQKMRAYPFGEGHVASGMPMTEARCARPGCGWPLGATNRSGYCYRCTNRHRRQIERRRES